MTERKSLPVRMWSHGHGHGCFHINRSHTRIQKQVQKKHLTFNAFLCPTFWGSNDSPYRFLVTCDIIDSA